jgi:hypothetical protein
VPKCFIVLIQLSLHLPSIYQLKLETLYFCSKSDYLRMHRISEAIADIDRMMARKVTPERRAKLQADREKLVEQMQRLAD